MHACFPKHDQMEEKHCGEIVRANRAASSSAIDDQPSTFPTCPSCHFTRPRHLSKRPFTPSTNVSAWRLLLTSASTASTARRVSPPQQSLGCGCAEVCGQSSVNVPPHGVKLGRLPSEPRHDCPQRAAAHHVPVPRNCLVAMPQGKSIKGRVHSKAARARANPYSTGKGKRSVGKTKKGGSFKAPKHAGRKGGEDVKKLQLHTRLHKGVEEMMAGRILQSGATFRMKEFQTVGKSHLQKLGEERERKKARTKAMHQESKDLKRAEKILRKAEDDEAKRAT